MRDMTPPTYTIFYIIHWLNLNYTGHGIFKGRYMHSGDFFSTQYSWINISLLFGEFCLLKSSWKCHCKTMILVTSTTTVLTSNQRKILDSRCIIFHLYLRLNLFLDYFSSSRSQLYEGSSIFSVLICRLFVTQQHCTIIILYYFIDRVNTII